MLRSDNTNAGNIVDVAPFAPGGNNIDATPYVRVQLQSRNDIFRISFLRPTTVFAADFQNLNDRGGNRRDTAFSVLGQDLLLPTVGRGEASFFGLVSDTAFTSVEFTRGSRDSLFGLDNVRFNSPSASATPGIAPVPLPGAAPLILTALASVFGLGWMRRRVS